MAQTLLAANLRHALDSRLRPFPGAPPRGNPAPPAHRETHSSSNTEDQWITILRTTSPQTGCSRRSLRRLAVSPEITGPLVWSNGVFLPSNSKTWSRERWDTVLRHEFTHVARRDGAVQIFAFLVCALHWFNPLAWLLLRQLRLEAEHACDDAVLTHQGHPADYAEHLLAVAAGGGVSSFAAPTMARVSTLRRRVEQILRADVNRHVRPGRGMRPAQLVVLSSAHGHSTWLPSPNRKAPAEPPKPAPAPEQVKAKTEGANTAQVTLTTTDADGKQLAGVSFRGIAVDTRGPNHPFQPNFEGTTDGQGHWSGTIPFGEYVVLATRDNLVAPESDHGQTYWYLNKKNSHPDLHLRLVEGGDILVRVVEALPPMRLCRRLSNLAGGWSTSPSWMSTGLPSCAPFPRGNTRSRGSSRRMATGSSLSTIPASRTSKWRCRCHQVLKCRARSRTRLASPSPMRWCAIIIPAR